MFYRQTCGYFPFLYFGVLRVIPEQLSSNISRPVMLLKSVETSFTQVYPCWLSDLLHIGKILLLLCPMILKFEYIPLHIYVTVSRTSRESGHTLTGPREKSEILIHSCSSSTLDVTLSDDFSVQSAHF